jgi:tetratricopeptide (TPR) repeat protein
MSLFRYAAAEQAFRRAFQVDSTFAHAHQWYGLYLSNIGRYDDALREMHLARDLDPTSRVIRTQTGLALYLAHRYAEADTEFRRDLEVDSTFHVTHRNYSVVLLAEGQYDAAARELTRVRQSSQLSWDAALYAHTLYLAGRKPEARALFDTLVDRSRRGPTSGTGLAILYQDFGEHERALTELTRAAQQFDWPLPRNGRTPLLADLRRDPRGAALIEKATR